MDAFEVLHTRRSIRQFLNRPVGEDLVKELLSAAMSAPTAGGIQPVEVRGHHGPRKTG